MRARHLPALTLAVLLPATGCATHTGQADPRSTTTAATTLQPSRLGPATITSCDPGAIATITVTNPTARVARYRVSVLFLNQAGTPVTVGAVDAQGMAPGETRAGFVTAETADPAAVQCAIERVDPL